MSFSYYVTSSVCQYITYSYIKFNEQIPSNNCNVLYSVKNAQFTTVCIYVQLTSTTTDIKNVFYSYVTLILLILTTINGLQL